MKEVLFKKEFSIFTSTEQKKETSLLQYIPQENYSSKHPYFQREKSYHDEETFLKNYGNPLYHLLRESFMVVVEKEGDKVVIKFFVYSTHRRPGVYWFKVYKSVEFLSVNTKTGNVYFGKIMNYQNKRKKQRKIQCNFFINDPLQTFAVGLKNNLTRFNPADASPLTFQAIDIFINNVDGRDDLTLGATSRLFKFYLDKKQIKYPNNFNIFSGEFYCKEFRQLLKKNNGKLVEATMKHHKVNGDKLRKALHEVSSYGFGFYEQAINFFGESWINQDYELLKSILEYKNPMPVGREIIRSFVELASPKEKKRFFNLFKLFVSERVVDSHNLSDHINFYVLLKNFGDTEVEWKSDGVSRHKFNEEHNVWATKVTYYRGGTYERFYPDILLNKIKEFEFIENETSFHAVILTNTFEYNDESSIQSNCVRTYLGRPSSIIVSLRKNSPCSEERLTIEYFIEKLDEQIYIEPIQVRAKYNQQPDESWGRALESLHNRVSQISKNNQPITYKLKKTCNNGVILESDTHFENGHLVWSTKSIDNVTGFYNYYL